VWRQNIDCRDFARKISGLNILRLAALLAEEQRVGDEVGRFRGGFGAHAFENKPAVREDAGVGVAGESFMARRLRDLDGGRFHGRSSFVFDRDFYGLKGRGCERHVCQRRSLFGISVSGRASFLTLYFYCRELSGINRKRFFHGDFGLFCCGWVGFPDLQGLDRIFEVPLIRGSRKEGNSVVTPCGLRDGLRQSGIQPRWKMPSRQCNSLRIFRHFVALLGERARFKLAARLH
jgi:hypothetical protein